MVCGVKKLRNWRLSSLRPRRRLARLVETKGVEKKKLWLTHPSRRNANEFAVYGVLGNLKTEEKRKKAVAYSFSLRLE